MNLKKSMITKPHIESDVAVYSLTGVVTEDTLDKFFNNLEQHKVILRSLKVGAVLFSLKKISSMENTVRDKLYKKFEELHGALKITTGICDYQSKDYLKIKKETTDSSLALVKTPKVAALVMGTSRISKNDTILVYDDDKDERNLMFSEFISKGYTVVAAKDRKDFKTRAQDRDRYGTIVRESRLSGIYDTVFVRFKDGFYTYFLRGYVNESLGGNFDLRAHKHRLEDGFKGFFFDFTRVTSIHIRSAFFLRELGKITSKYKGRLYIFGLDTEKVSSNIQEVLKKSEICFFDTIDECIDDAHLNGYERGLKDLDEENGAALTKEIVQKIPIFARATLNSIDTFAGTRGKKKIGRTRVSELMKYPIYSVGKISFDGDMSGTLFLLISKNIINKVAKTMLGEENLDKNAIKDLTSEVMNTIGGKIKTVISDSGIPISISLPDSFLSKIELQKKLGNKEGIGVELSLDDEPFHLFLIGSVLNRVL